MRVSINHGGKTPPNESGPTCIGSLVRVAANMIHRRRRRIVDERQLELSLDWSARECKDARHAGNRWLPVESFVKNGAFRRSSCKTCWAAGQREREKRAVADSQNDQSLVQMLNRLWRPTRPTSAA